MQVVRHSTLSSLINFKCKIVINLIVFWKDKIVCVSLVNVTVCLNIVRELNLSFAAHGSIVSLLPCFTGKVF